MERLKEPMTMTLSNGTRVVFQVRVIHDDHREFLRYNRDRDINSLLYNIYSDPASYPRPWVSRTTDGRVLMVVNGERSDLRNINTIDHRQPVDPWNPEYRTGPPDMACYHVVPTGPQQSVAMIGDVTLRSKAAHDKPPESWQIIGHWTEG